MLEQVRRRLCELQDEIRSRVIAARRRQPRRLAAVAAETAADTIYRIDRVSEAVIVDWLTRRWPQRWPVEIVMEGLEEPLTFPVGTPVRATAWKLILDPIDGTRGIMHDKRSAWSLAGLAPQRGRRTQLGDIVVAAMTELPTTRQWRADQFSAVAGTGRVVGTAHDVIHGGRRRLVASPSVATELGHAFATVSRFFPAGKTWLAELEERLWRDLGVLDAQGGGTPVFEDQYIASGGQLAEVLCGRDLCVIDARPAAFAALALDAALSSHPYDLCTELILREAGSVVTDLNGRRLRAPLDTTTPVGWAAYANPALARRIGPVLRRLIKG